MTSTVKPLRILVLGGTGFIGPHLVEYALSRGHTLTLFNRGRTKPGLFPKAEQLIGDRNAPDGHAALAGRTWDVVFDLPATTPQWVVNAAAVLKGKVDQYVYVSSTAAYKDFARSFPDETHPTQDPAPITGPDAAAAPFGNKKVRCEQLVQEAFGNGATIVRRVDRRSWRPHRPLHLLARTHRKRAARYSRPASWKIRRSGSMPATWPSGWCAWWNRVRPVCSTPWARGQYVASVSCCTGSRHVMPTIPGSRGCPSRFSPSRRCARGQRCRCGATRGPPRWRSARPWWTKP